MQKKNHFIFVWCLSGEVYKPYFEFFMGSSYTWLAIGDTGCTQLYGPSWSNIYYTKSKSSLLIQGGGVLRYN